MTTEEAIHHIYDFLSRAESPQPADLAFAFGSYHAPVAETAARLVLDDYAPLLICSGGSSGLTKDLGMTEADYFGDIAEKAGVSPEKILREGSSTNTGDNIKNSMILLREHGIEPKTILVCGMPAHLCRIVATFAKQEPAIRIIPILVPFQFSDYRTKKGMNLGLRLVAELDRLREYPEQGFTVPVEIPASVQEAERVIIANQGE